MSTVIETVALSVPDQEKLDQFDSLSTEEQQDVLKDVIDMQSTVADASLRSEEGYDILLELYRCNAEILLLTSHFVLPVSNHIERICEDLSDPEGFKRSFITLLADIKSYRDDLDTLYQCHKGKSGTPSEEDITEVFAIADGYSKLLDRYEGAIRPLKESLRDVLLKECKVLMEEVSNA